MKTISLLFVCMGNICRSPTAHGVLLKMAAQAKPELKLHVDSAGTHNYHPDSPPDTRSQAHAKARGYDLSPLRARQVTTADFAQFDLILAMDHANVDALKERCPPEHWHKIQLLTQWCKRNTAQIVPDPYYGGSQGFEHVLDLVEDACENLLKHLLMHLQDVASESPAPEATKVAKQSALNRTALMACLPQRGALFACQSLLIKAPLHFVGTAMWEASHPGLEGHFPEAPTVPGVLLIEAASQLAGAGLIHTQTDLQQLQSTHRGVLASIRQCRFRAPVMPETAIKFSLQCRRRGALQIQIEAVVSAGHQTLAELDILLIYAPRRNA